MVKLAAILLIAIFGSALAGEFCRVNPEDRKECGPAGISRHQCESRGCCFNDKTPGMIWCYHEAVELPGPCSVNPEDRVECGHAGISKQSCLASPNCCFNNKYPHVKWCYKEHEYSDGNFMERDMDEYLK